MDIDNSYKNKRIAKNSIFMSIRMVIVLGISLYTTRLILQVLGVGDYGIFNVVAGFVTLFGFLNTSMSNGIQRFYNFELGKNGKDGANKVYCTSLEIQTLLAFLIIIITETFGIWYIENNMVLPDDRRFAAELIFQFAVFSLVLTILQAPYTAAVLAHEHMDFFAIISVLDALLKLIVVIIVKWTEIDHLIFYGLLIALISVANFILYYVYSKKKFTEISWHPFFDRDLFFSMLKFSGWNLFGSFSNMMRSHGVNLILNVFFGPVVNAARGIAVQVNSGVTNFVTSIIVPIRPQVIQSFACGDIRRSISLTYSVSKFCLLVYLVLTIPVCLEINYCLNFWLGDEIPEHTHSFCIIILIITSVLIPMNSLATLVHASGNMKNYQLIGSTVKVLSVPIAYIILKLGCEPEWAFVMVLLFDIIGFVVGLYIIKQLMDFSISSYMKRVFLPIFPLLGLDLSISLLLRDALDEGLVRFLVLSVFSTLVLSLLFYFIAMSKTEKQMFFEIINNRIRKK